MEDMGRCRLIVYFGAAHGVGKTCDATLRRHPTVALVDELAHTNVPGTRNEMRWQDVEVLLDAGINVITTVNIQRLESLNQVAESITGIKQRETIPDAVVRRGRSGRTDRHVSGGVAPPARARKRLPAREDRHRACERLPRRQSHSSTGARPALGG